MWAIDECGECGHAFMNPQPDWADLGLYYSSEYPPYDPSRETDGSDDRLVQLALETGRLRHIPIPRGKRILDVGCGGGSFLRAAQRLGASTMGVEPSEVGSARARASGLDVFTGTLEQFVERTASREQFDIITCCHVLEHVPRPVQTLVAMRALLRPNGFAWIAVPNADCVFARKLGWRWHSTDLPYHLMQFTPKSLIKAAEAAGLSISRWSTDSPRAAVRSSICALLRYRCMIPSRVSQALLPKVLVAQVAQTLDRRREGEAILLELRVGGIS